MVIFSKNSLYSIISLIFVILGSSFILFCFEIEFLVFILLLIYIGAIAVLFLFIIMMLELNQEKTETNLRFELSTTKLLYIIFLIKLNIYFYYLNEKLSISLNTFCYEFLQYNDDLNIFYNSLFKINNDIFLFLFIFTEKYFFFGMVGLILLFAMVGSIALCLLKKFNR